MRGCTLNSTILCLTATLLAARVAAQEDIEFVAEHLPEVAMDNRYAALPLWGSQSERQPLTFELQAGVSQTTAGDLEIRGPLASFAVRRPLNDRWQVGAFAFYDSLQFQADRERRPLQTLFAASTPLARPVDAEFSNLDGTATDYGAGVQVFNETGAHAWGRIAWTAGLLWQRIRLSDYRLDYRILDGPQAEQTGQIDFDTHYEYLVPFVGVQALRHYDAWAVNAHLLVACPLPRRAFVGHITGPGFDIRGDTEDGGYGTHVGDPSVTLGLTFVYVPAHLAIDVGALVSQALLEPHIHRGIERNLMLSVSWSR